MLNTRTRAHAPLIRPCYYSVCIIGTCDTVSVAGKRDVITVTSVQTTFRLGGHGV